MNYAIEESVVDAVVAYLSAATTGAAMVMAAPSTQEVKYPAVVVRASELSPLTPGVSWNDQAMMKIEIAIISQAAPEVNDSGVVITSARMNHALVRASVLTGLTIKDSADTPEGLADLFEPEDLPRGLAAELSAMQIPGIVVTSAQPDSPLAQMQVDEEHNALVTVISLNVIAQATEIA
jgi:hypothetical protein